MAVPAMAQNPVRPAKSAANCAGQSFKSGQTVELTVLNDGTLCLGPVTLSPDPATNRVSVYYGGTSTPILSTDVAPTTGFGSGTLAKGGSGTMTGTTSTSVIGGTALNYIYVTWCIVSNSSLTVSTNIVLQDGSGGTTLATLPAPAATVATTGGGGAMFPFPIAPLKVDTAGNGLFAANVTTGSSTTVTCGGYKSTTSH